MSTITISQREIQTGHKIGNCSMPRRCPREVRWHNPKRWLCRVRRPSHVVRTEACSLRNFAREYACPGCVPIRYVEHQLGTVHSIDVVWDNYRPYSLKAQTRNTRGKWIRRRVEPIMQFQKIRRIAQNQRERDSPVRISVHINCHIVNSQASHLCYRQWCIFSATYGYGRTSSLFTRGGRQ